jgi:lipoate-protein ligase B
MSAPQPLMEWQDLGHMPYREAWALQEALRTQRREGTIADRLLFASHPPVITVGRRACAEDLLSPPEALAAAGIELVATNRGGRATYHGPGQIMGYWVCDLRAMRQGVEGFVRAIEEVCARALADVGIACAHDEEHPGLWVGREKIVAVGLHVARGITQHGFAVNVDGDLAAYRHLVACGIAGRGVTSMARLLGRPPRKDSVKRALIERAGEVFGCRMVERRAADDHVNVSASGEGATSSAGGSS